MKAQGEFYSMGLSVRETALTHQTCIYRSANSSSTGEKDIIYALGNLGGTKIGLRIVTQILSCKINSHKIRCRT